MVRADALSHPRLLASGERRRLTTDSHGLNVGSRAIIFAGVLIGGLYALGMIIRGDVVPGLVGGALAAVLCVLVLREVEARRRRRPPRSGDSHR
jgi:hypothetical protein